MTAIGGSIIEVTIRGRIFAVISDAAATRKLGGFENQLAPNGNGTMRVIKQRGLWDVSGLQVEIDDARGDQEFLQSIADSNELVPITLKFASQTVYQATGTVHGEIPYDNQTASSTISLGGGDTLSQQ